MTPEEQLKAALVAFDTGLEALRADAKTAVETLQSNVLITTLQPFSALQMAAYGGTDTGVTSAIKALEDRAKALAEAP
ncbi:hypothetical protein EOE18_15340 [Novosphingobium umbonatum]|uniref:Uncharacterized protein n=1 Tax=Novosphingobium umbonatum TaxID=1908524 RepID=A0A3S3TL19_9SPHN|nr:hypothetical protein [Novosphingobium umbonatum]RVU03495.1 hypothetical protein EOE18_15340 [Novosphingobium umbonatum]